MPVTRSSSIRSATTPSSSPSKLNSSAGLPLITVGLVVSVPPIFCMLPTNIRITFSTPTIGCSALSLSPPPSMTDRSRCACSRVAIG